MARRLALLAPLAAVALAPASAYADGQDAPAIERHHELRVDGGFASAIGYLGVTWTSDVGRILRVEGGAGIGLTGFQFSVMPKLAFGNGSSRFLMGAGPAFGIAPGRNDLFLALWLNADLVGWSWRKDDGTSIAAGAGVTACVAASGRMEYDPSPGMVLPQFRIGGGWAF